MLSENAKVFLSFVRFVFKEEIRFQIFRLLTRVRNDAIFFVKKHKSRCQQNGFDNFCGI